MNTVGTINFVAGTDFHPPCWAVEAPPDVMVRLKRIFPSARQSKALVLSIQDSPELAYELKWVCERFPLEVMNPHRLNRRANEYVRHLNRLQAIEASPRLAGDFAMAIPARDYQAFAASLMLEKGGVLLGDVIGLGKTATCICTMTDKRTLPTCVTVQAHLTHQWEEEINKFLPDAKVHIIASRKNYPLPDADVYICTYSKLTDWIEHLAVRIKSIHFDEVQELRIPESAKYRAAKLLCESVKYRFGLSATPIHNYGGEIFQIYNLLAPGALGNLSEFTREWCTQYHDKSIVDNPEALGHWLRRNFLFIRRTRKEVGRELPPVMRCVQEIGFDQKVYDSGTSSATDLAKLILAGTFLERGQASREFDLRLRQATGLAKAPYVADLVRMAIENGEKKILLSGWHRSVYDIWAERLRDLGVVFYTGSESPGQKQAAKEAFINDPKTSVMVISNRSGSGLNGLQDVCSCVVIGELDWAPPIISQIIGRVARDGQSGPVQVFIPVAPVGSDPAMADVLGVKQAQAVGILDVGESIDLGVVQANPERIRILAEEFLRRRHMIADIAVSSAS
jgi:SNF2 family DNA or RNA helicase